ncbi:hypothetical protein [Alicyclobacillus acidiphilus]|uniref:hypothetical protein n=1 Tax=Alicyclobacillus acidiphilus TaxID=182455 RepID=UPI00083480F3|nr:hypothetical protein [Alicyclobacillus acidiphilus]
MIKFAMVRNSRDFSQSEFSDIVNTLRATDGTLENCTIIILNSTICEFRLEYKSGQKYFVTCNLVTHKTAQLVITIEAQKETGTYDFQLEQIKIRLKDLLIKTWDSCIWLADSQVLELSATLYTSIHRTENKLREFINSSMVVLFGITWWEDYVQPNLRNVYDTHRQRQGPYKRDVPSFANVDDSLLSINTDDLWSLMNLKVTKWVPKDDPILEAAIRDGKADKVLELSKKHMEVVLDVWSKYLQPCFDDKFETEWRNFTRNRNHIAHNKLIDHAAHAKIAQNIDLVYQMIEDAERKFSELHLSEEEKEALIDCATEPDEEERIEAITGIKIYGESDIESMFLEKLTDFQAGVSDELYFRRDLDVETDEIKGTHSEFLRVSSKLVEDEKFTFVCNFEITDGRGNSSICIIQLVNSANEILEQCELEFTNGDYEFDEETGYSPRVQATLDDSALEKFHESVLDIINDKFPDLVQEIKVLNYMAVKDGGEPPVADFPCCECGEFTVSISNELWEIGVCVSCGAKHNLERCIRCEAYYNADELGSDTFCESCSEYLEAQ